MKECRNGDKLSEAIENRLEQYGHPKYITQEKIRAHSATRLIIGIRMQEKLKYDTDLTDKQLAEALNILEELLPCPRF